MTDQQTNIVSSGHNLSKLYIAINSVSLILFIWFFYNSFYELFIYVEKVHYPRIMIGQAEENSYYFRFDVPTLCNLIIIIASLLSLVSSIMIFLVMLSQLKKKIRKYWIVQITGFIICLLCELVLINDFFSNAFDGVG